MTHRPEGSSQALLDVMHAARSLVHRLRWSAARLHGEGELSAAKRGVLMSLDVRGPQTVPELARARPVSRQHIQMLVNPLIAEGLVEHADNPRHKRSKRLQLTRRGRRRVQAMRRREQALFQSLDLPIPEQALRETALTLENLRRFLESEAWERALRQQSRRRAPTRAARSSPQPPSRRRASRPESGSRPKRRSRS
jgi:DNA-binding MarR family transcriptional regulator